MLKVANKIDLFEVRKSESPKVRKKKENKSKSGKIFSDKGGPPIPNTKLSDFGLQTSDFGLRTSDFLSISAKEKLHIDELKQHIYNSAIKDKLTGDETLVTNIRHLEALQKTEEALLRVLEGIDTVTSDFLAMDIKLALHYLGEITGAVTTDDLLENIFSKFCIGK